MKLTPYKEALVMGKNALNKKFAPMRANKAKRKAELEMAILDEEIATAESDIEEACADKEINFKKIIRKMDDLTLLERKKRQIKKIIEEMFPDE